MWKLLTHTKQKSFRLWLIFFSVCFLIVLLQSWTGRLNGILGMAWLWFFLCLEPGLVLLLIAALHDRKSNLLITRSAHRIVMGFTLTYLLLVIITLLAESWAIQGKLSIQTYRQQSFFWLLPLQVILILSYSTLFWNKHSRLFNKLPLNIVAQQKADLFGEDNQKSKQQAFNLIAEGKTKKALEHVSEHIRNSGIGDLPAITLLQAQWSDNKKKRNLGLLTEEEAQRNENKQIMTLMNIILKS